MAFINGATVLFIQSWMHMDYVYNTARCVCEKEKSSFRKDIKMKIFLLFTKIYPKINSDVVQAMLPSQ